MEILKEMEILTTQQSEYYTAAEVANILRQTKRDKIYTMCRSGELKAFLFGRTWLIDKEYFDKWRKAQMPSWTLSRLAKPNL